VRKRVAAGKRVSVLQRGHAAGAALPRPHGDAVQLPERGAAHPCAAAVPRRRSNAVADADLRDLVKRQFGLNAERYVSSYDHSKGESLDRMLARVAPRPEWRVLDIATGGGHTALAFAPRVREVVATDITREMLDAAERFVRGKGVTNVRFAEADACALPFDAAEFDLVTCRVAPHHFPDPAKFAREMARVLKPGGVATMIDNVVPEDRATGDYINAFEKFRDPSHVRAYTKAEWLQFFTDVGFKIEATEIFRKARDFEAWAGLQTVRDPVKAELRRRLETAPPGAAEVLGPETREGKLYFYLTEILIVARRPPGRGA
jgi:ubiquinone/menaquinone biosynthesis C-methylase UbiE